MKAASVLTIVGEAFNAFAEVLFYFVLAALWPLLHLISLMRPSPYPPSLTRLLEGPIRRRFASRERCLEHSGLRPGMRVLEVGPGGGWLTEAACTMLGSSDQLVCLDIQTDMLNQIRTRLRPKRPGLVCASGSTLPFRDAVFDLVFLVSVLGEIPDKHGALNESRRVLRAGGILAVTESFPDPDYVRKRLLRRWATRAGLGAAECFASFGGYTHRFVRQRNAHA
jgi:ubiquinone/menaquinone biosynthesis C-methylase UbiE